MTKLPFLQIDAFTERPLEGNPCAVVLDADGLGAHRMQTIAREMNLSETAFLHTSRRADFGARYFTPAEEIPLAGHPTIALTHALVETGRLELDGERTSFELELLEGPVRVEVLTSMDRSPRIVMQQRRPRFLDEHAADEVLPAFGLEPRDALPEAPIQTVSTGTPQLMLPLRGLDVLERAALDIPRYSKLRADGDFFSPHLFCLEGFTDDGDTAARHFGLPPDTLEDPFTGSATGGMAAYLWRHGLIDRPRFVAEQGHPMGRPGRADVEVLTEDGQVAAVRVGGRAVTVVRGEILVPAGAEVADVGDGSEKPARGDRP